MALSDGTTEIPNPPSATDATAITADVPDIELCAYYTAVTLYPAGQAIVVKDASVPELTTSYSTAGKLGSYMLQKSAVRSWSVPPPGMKLYLYPQRCS